MSGQFSNVELHLKQVDVPALGELGTYVMDTAFGAYHLDIDDKIIEHETAALSRRMAGADVWFDRTPPRRFAGDRSLPRSRYYSIADDDAGWDARTLLHEMSAYLVGSRYPGLVSFFDTSVMNSAELLGILAEVPKKNNRALNLSLPSFLVALRPITRDRVLEAAYGKGRHYVVQVPFTLTTEMADHVIDLRRPPAQAWLVERFNSRLMIDGEESPVLLNREPLTGFAQLLPSLLDQWLGGNWSTGNLAGVFARQAGGSGLVYPSARSNPRVDLENGTVRDSSGWCFVRYAGAPEMEVSGGISEASDEWPTTAGFAPATASWVKEFIPLRGTAIHHVTSGRDAGSWHVEGVAEFNSSFYRLAQAGAVLRSIDDDIGDDV